MISSYNPRTAEIEEEVGPDTSSEQVAALCARAFEVAKTLEGTSRSDRAAMLRSMADSLAADSDGLIAVADRETALGTARLTGELTRTIYQLRFFADVLTDGGYLEATIDHRGDTDMGSRPDLRRILRAIGPVGVFGASNFPFAFSVPGGDTASALAAGCPVVVKAHEAHPLTSLRSAEALRRGAAAVGIPEDVVALVFGVDAGLELVRNPQIRAVGFTGSPSGGRSLWNIATARPDPIPFYGELGALNAIVICPAATTNRSLEIATGLATSFMLGVGQFCTKPGLALVPSGADGDELVARLSRVVAGQAPAPMLSARVHDNFVAGRTALQARPGVALLAEGAQQDSSSGWWGTPILLEVSSDSLDGPVLNECFGPILIVARYGSEDELDALLVRIGPALTATIHADPADLALGRWLVKELTGRAGRIVWNGYPTGVAVAWAMHHGGPYPASTDVLHTSVGASAIRRWLRPVSYQDLPAALLPLELTDDPPADFRVPRRVDGRMSVS